MANKFQKSVLERLEQEAVRQKQKAREPAEKAEAVITAAEIPLKEGPEAQAARTSAGANEAEPKPVREDPPLRPSPDISGYLIREPQRLAKNKTFYLDGDVIEAIKSAARSQNVTDSKLVNDILRRVLGI